MKGLNRRVTQLGVFFLLIFAALFVQLNHIQLVQANKLANAPGNSRVTTRAFSYPRGSILTSDGQVIAESVPSKDVYHYQRVYPNGPLYGDVSGFDSIIYGLSGIESSYNSYLAGGAQTIHSVSDLFRSSYVTDSVVTTINSKLQQIAYDALGSLNGAVVVLNPTNGNVLAMVSKPSYDPNPLASHSGTVEETTWKADISGPNPPLLNTAIARAYPPGSTFKIVTSSAVYDHKPKIATQNFPVVASIPLPDTTHTLHNYAFETCGGMLPELLKVSCDTGYAQVGLELGASNIASEATNFGFNQIPPLDIPGAAASGFPAASFFNQNLPQLAFSAIGQGNVNATTLQMALVASGIADKGVIMAPHLMARITDSQDHVVKMFAPKIWKVATSASTALQVTQLMIGVVNGGTASAIALPGIQIAAKTGTAQTNLTSGGSAVGQSDNWMVAFAPANAPQVAVAVVVPEQPGLGANPTGAQYAGPVVKAVLAAALGIG